MTTTLGTSNTRTSLRQTRTNPTRISKTVGSSLRQNSLISNAPAAAPNAQDHGFYPAITHFTDAITALPREFRRHTSLLKEVDAKAWAPEAHLQTLLTACVNSKPSNNLPVEIQSAIHPILSTCDPNIQSGHTDGSTSVVDNASAASTQSQHDLQSFEHRKTFYNLRGTLTEMMVSMDEKNHLINSANEDLSRHLKRLTTIYPHIEGEVSEEARLGSLTHWAYIENRPSTRANAASSRREAAAGLAAMHDTDIASRSESRREAMLARKQRQIQIDSDFDDPRPAKRANVNGKSKRVGETAAESGAGLGISVVAPVVKKKRAEKPAAAGVAMERSISGALGGRPMSREPSQQEGTKKRKAPAAGTTAARKRINTANSAANSPKLASSPLVGAFGKDARRNSPMPGNTRPQSSRARQNSTQGRPASSASNKHNVNGVGVSASTPELHNMTAMTGRSTDEVRSTTKETVNNKGERLVEEAAGSSVNGTNDMKGGILLERTASRGGVNNVKREEASASGDSLPAKTKSAASPRIPPPTALNADLNSTSTSTRPEREREQRPSRARSSKTSTPIVNTFAESETSTTTRENQSRTDPKFKRPPSSSSRSARNKDPLYDSLSPSGLPPKRSHKKGAGLAAQAAVLQAKLAKQSNGNSKADASKSNSSASPSPFTAATATAAATSSAADADAGVEAQSETDAPTPNPKSSRTAQQSPPKSPAQLPASNNTDPLQPHHSNNHAKTNPPPATQSLPPADPPDDASTDDVDPDALDSSGEEPRYCYCQQVSYGEMVACDAEDCPREWFHLECVGLGRAPGRNARWFCEECKERLKMGQGAGVAAVAGGVVGVVANGQGGGRRGR